MAIHRRHFILRMSLSGEHACMWCDGLTTPPIFHASTLPGTHTLLNDRTKVTAFRRTGQYSKKPPTRHETADPSAISPRLGGGREPDATHPPPCQSKSCVFLYSLKLTICFCDKVPAEVKNTAGMPSYRLYPRLLALSTSSGEQPVPNSDVHEGDKQIVRYEAGFGTAR